MSPELFRLDPRTTLLVILSLNVVMFSAGFSGGSGVARIVFMTIPFVLAIGLGRIIAGLCYFVLVIAAYVAETWWLENWPGGISFIASGLASLVARLAPGAFMAYLAVVSIRVSELMASLEALHIPRHIVIPISVILRFLPTVREESRGVQAAMNARGLTLYRVGVLPWMEYRLIPLIISTVRSGEELSQAALTRSLGRPGRVYRIAKIGPGPADVVIWLAIIAGIGAWIVW